jgi:hypothetical protein
MKLILLASLAAFVLAGGQGECVDVTIAKDPVRRPIDGCGIKKNAGGKGCKGHGGKGHDGKGKHGNNEPDGGCNKPVVVVEEQHEGHC